MQILQTSFNKRHQLPISDVFQLLWKIICPEILTPPSGEWLQLIGTEVGLWPILGYFESHPSMVHWNWKKNKSVSCFPGGSVVKKPPAMQKTQETQIWSLGREDPLEEAMESHSCILAWRIPWTEEPGGLQSMESQRTGHNWSDWASTNAGMNH